MEDVHALKDQLRATRRERERVADEVQGEHDSRRDELGGLERTLRAAKDRIEA